MWTITRRHFIAAGGTVGLLAPLPALGGTATPRQSEGPYYPDRLPLDTDNDLVRVEGQAGRARGEVFHLFGRVSDEAGRPVAGAAIEIWQCDANGVYRHSTAPGRENADPAFQGFGKTATAGDGLYRFRTITPVPYAGRAPHIHVKVRAPGRAELTTQMYLAGHPANVRDYLFRHAGGSKYRALLSVRQTAAPEIEPGAVKGTFNIVLA